MIKHQEIRYDPTGSPENALALGLGAMPVAGGSIWYWVSHAQAGSDVVMLATLAVGLVLSMPAVVWYRTWHQAVHDCLELLQITWEDEATPGGRLAVHIEVTAGRRSLVLRHIEARIVRDEWVVVNEEPCGDVTTIQSTATLLADAEEVPSGQSRCFEDTLFVPWDALQPRRKRADHMRWKLETRVGLHWMLGTLKHEFPLTVAEA